MGRIEDLILQKNWRGMDLLRQYLPQDYCERAANAIRNWKRGNVMLLTGFYVDGHAETDGPPGTLLLVDALREAGFYPIVITDEVCRGYFELDGIATVYVPIDADDQFCYSLLEQYAPVGLIAVERCGKNIAGFYDCAEEIEFECRTAPVDRVFELASAPKIGIGDGGNEVGMGSLLEAIQSHLKICPCRIPSDYPIVATVSNWGALALADCLGYLPEEKRFMEVYERALSFGYVDGFTGENVLTEDKFPLEVGLQLLRDLRTL